jgi:hypothetical protein
MLERVLQPNFMQYQPLNRAFSSISSHPYLNFYYYPSTRALTMMMIISDPHP